MDIFEVSKNGWMILDLKGRMDAITAPAVRERIMAVIERGERRLLLDCSGLEYVSSAGLRVLFEAACRLQDLSGKIGCYGLNANVRKVFSLADLGTDIPIHENQEIAIHA